MGTLLLLILAEAYHPLLRSSIAAFVVLYAMAQFFFNFGTSTTTNSQ